MSAFSQMQTFRDLAVASLREAEETIEHLQQQRSSDLDSIHEYLQHIDAMQIRHDKETVRLRALIDEGKTKHDELLERYRASIDKYRTDARNLKREQAAMFNKGIRTDHRLDDLSKPSFEEFKRRTALKEKLANSPPFNSLDELITD